MKSFHHHIISSWYFLRDGDLDAQLFPLRLAKTSILLRFPVIRPHSRNGIEQVVRVVFVLDLFQPRVVHAIVVALPVTIAEIRLIEVRASIRSQLSQLRNQNISHQILVREHVLPRRSEAPWRGDDGVDEVVAPSWVDGVVRVAGSRERSVGRNSDELGALLVDEAIRGCERRVIVFNHGSRNEAAAVLCDSDIDWVGIEHDVEVVQVAVELDEVAGVFDVEVVELGHQRCEEFSQFGDGHVGAGQR